MKQGTRSLILEFFVFWLYRSGQDKDDSYNGDTAASGEPADDAEDAEEEEEEEPQLPSFRKRNADGEGDSPAPEAKKKK